MADLIVLKVDNPYGATRALSAVRALEALRYDVAVVDRHCRSASVTIGGPRGGTAWADHTAFLRLNDMPPSWQLLDEAIERAATIRPPRPLRPERCFAAMALSTTCARVRSWERDFGVAPCHTRHLPTRTLDDVRPLA